MILVLCIESNNRHALACMLCDRKSYCKYIVIRCFILLLDVLFDGH